MEEHVCADGFFRCNSGQCVAGNLKCNNRTDCDDGSDENDCPIVPNKCDELTQFDCTNDGTSCIPLDKVCDQHSDCAGGEDENLNTCAKKSMYIASNVLVVWFSSHK